MSLNKSISERKSKRPHFGAAKEELRLDLTKPNKGSKIHQNSNSKLKNYPDGRNFGLSFSFKSNVFERNLKKFVFCHVQCVPSKTDNATFKDAPKHRVMKNFKRNENSASMLGMKMQVV